MKPYLWVKGLIDVMAALFLLILVSPILLITAIAVKVSSPGPVLFRQPRPGKGGKVFRVFKFRTMRVETEVAGRLLSATERITPIGGFLRAWSIDELPQFLNILRLEMSFIGPRPLLVQYLPFYTATEMRRHEVRPGISGWAQVNGRNAISWERKFELDVEYVDNISFLLDCRIAWLTILRVLGKSDIIAAGEADSTIALDIERTQKRGNAS